MTIGCRCAAASDTAPTSREDRKKISTTTRLCSRLSLLRQIAIFDVADRDRPARDGARHAPAEMQRRATRERRGDGIAIKRTRLVRRVRRRVGPAWRGDHLAAALRNSGGPTLPCRRAQMIFVRQSPAGAQHLNSDPMASRSPSGSLGRRHLESRWSGAILPDREAVVRNADAVLEHAAKAGVQGLESYTLQKAVAVVSGRAAPTSASAPENGAAVRAIILRRPRLAP